MEPFVIERTYASPISKVWEAITVKEKMKEWYFDLKEFEPRVGFEFEFEGGEPGKNFVHHCKITEVVVNKKLTYSWYYKGYPGMSYVSFELFDEGPHTRLRLTHTGLATFPADPSFARKNFEMGWNDLIGNQLSEYLLK